jgi:hypothetical protein
LLEGSSPAPAAAPPETDMRFTAQDRQRIARACQAAAESLAGEDLGTRGQDDRGAVDFGRLEAALKHLSYFNTPQRRHSAGEAAQFLVEFFAELRDDIARG